MTRALVLSAACLAPLLGVTLAVGPLPDSDRAAHTLWAGQLADEGSLVISPDGTVNDWTMYYPNTVPKPGDLLLGLLGNLPWKAPETVIWLAVAWMALFAGVRAAGEGFPGLLAGVFLGTNPVFLNLCLARSPAVPFMALILWGCRRGSPGASALASLVRPEGFIYGVRDFLERRSPWALAVMAVSLAFWILLNAGACGDLLWTAREVRYCVAAMDYDTPNPVTFPSWLLLRVITVLGPVFGAALLVDFRRWRLAVPAGINVFLLWTGLVMGSLVLPRYADQVILLAVPFCAGRTGSLFPGVNRALLAALCLAGGIFAWPETLDSWRTEAMLDRGLASAAGRLPEGRVAANELVIPRLALLRSRVSYPEGYVALDRAVWEGAGEEDLLRQGVTSIVVFMDDFYLSDHAAKWLDSLSGSIPVITIPGPGETP